MKDGLACIGADIGDDAVAALAQSQFLRQPIGGDKQQCQHGTVLRRQVRHGGDMSPGDEEDMVWGLWIDVFKGDHVFILVDYFSGYLSLCYFAKQAVLNNHDSRLPP